MTIVESIGLHETQEKAVKNIVSNTLWDKFRDCQQAVPYELAYPVGIGPNERKAKED